MPRAHNLSVSFPGFPAPESSVLLQPGTKSGESFSYRTPTQEAGDCRNHTRIDQWRRSNNLFLLRSLDVRFARSELWELS
jgi:hypothetical protein